MMINVRDFAEMSEIEKSTFFSFFPTDLKTKCL